MIVALLIQCQSWNVVSSKEMACIAEAQGSEEYAPDKIRNLGTAGAMAGGVQCVVGGVKRMTETTGQNDGSLGPRYEWTRLRVGGDRHQAGIRD